MRLFAGLLATAIAVAFSSAAFAKAKDNPNFGYTSDGAKHRDLTTAQPTTHKKSKKSH